MVPLEWHVDHRDHLGWKDPFGSKDHTARQKAYAKALGLKGVVTPQVLVGGKPQGPDWQDRVEGAAKEPALAALSADLSAEGGTLRAKVKAGEPRGAVPATAVLRAVLFQREATTAVTGGENAGKALRECFVVRGAAEPVPFEAARKAPPEFSFPVPGGTDPVNLGVAVILEDPATMTPLEAASFLLPVKPVAGKGVKPLLVVCEWDSSGGEAVTKAIGAEAEMRGFAVAVLTGDPADDAALGAWLDEKRRGLDFDPRRVILLGYSTAAGRAWDIAVRCPARVGALVIVGGAFPVDGEKAKSFPEKMPVALVYGRGDTVAPAQFGEDARTALVAAGRKPHWVLLPLSDHAAVLKEGATRFLPWARDRVTGR